MITAHICQAGYRHLAGMSEFYERAGIAADSEEAKIALIRSHIAYWTGLATAERIVVRRYRKHAFKAGDITLRIVNMLDHRNGVIGWLNQGIA